jgi:hypothetical protein
MASSIQTDSDGLQVWDPHLSSGPLYEVRDAHGNLLTIPPRLDPNGSSIVTEETLVAEIEQLKVEMKRRKRRNIFWIVALIAVIAILVGFGGGLAAKYVQQHKKAEQVSFSAPTPTSKYNQIVIKIVQTELVWTQSYFVTQVPGAGGSTIYSIVTTRAAAISTDQSSGQSATNVPASIIIEVPPIQADWRYCQNCHSMFYNGYTNAGACVYTGSGGAHVAQGFNFDLPHDIVPTTTSQDQWRFCTKCFVMFYNGDNDKGTCVKGGGHTAEGFVFVLTHDIPSTMVDQDQWKFCSRCHTMFYDGYADKGLCAAGDGHTSSGYNFVLPHDLVST